MTQKNQKDLFEISSTRELLAALLLAGGVATVVSISPALLAAAVPFAVYKNKKEDKKKRKKFQDTFRYLQLKGYIEVESRKQDISITLTERGKKAARRGYFKTSVSKPKIPKKWDGIWRIIIFDVPMHDHIKRNAFRKLIRQLGARMLQQSVWVYPYDCEEQITFLKVFFEMDDDQVRLIEAQHIGDDRVLRRYFKI